MACSEESEENLALKLNVFRGIGTGSRLNLSTEKLSNLGWTVLEKESTTKGCKRTRLTYIDPNGKKFKSAKDVETNLKEKGLWNEVSFDEIECKDAEDQSKKSDSESDSGSDSSDPDFELDEEDDQNGAPLLQKEIRIDDGLFVGTMNSIVSLVEQFNKYFKCPSDSGMCKGKLVLVASQKKGLGGSIKLMFRCSGCWREGIHYKSSRMALKESRRPLVSLALSLAFFVSGHGYAGYRKTLGKGLGLGIVSEKPYLDLIKRAFPVIKEILDELCDDAKQQMKDISSELIGSWSRAVTTCDGCWQIRGHFSQNCTFIIKNYLTGGLLYYGHLSMRGADNICDEELWKGTAKAAEGHLAQVIWAKAKEENLVVEVNWQDADSSSANSFRYSYPNELESKIMLCGGHVGRAHGKKLKELQTKSTVTSQFIALHIKQFPEIKSVKCCCAGKKHVFTATKNRPVCGCIGPGFIQSAKRNHYCALVHAGKDPEKYRETMLTLGKYHCRDIHEWKGGSCSFHPLLKCVCKKCELDENGFCPDMKCSGEKYHSAHVLKCEFHALLYEIECSARATNAGMVIDPSLGKGHSNLPESSFSVLTKFRAKDINLHQTHYQASTNLGLLQSCMTWCYKYKGPQYHWMVDLYSRMGLPILDGIQAMCQKDNETRMKKLERKKTEKGKRQRVQIKVDRVEEQKLRKKYAKSLQIRHYYGDEDAEEDDDNDEDAALEITEHAIANGTAPRPMLPEEVITPAPAGAEVNIGGNKCKWCGSTTHFRKSNKKCPFYKKK